MASTRNSHAEYSCEEIGDQRPLGDKLSTNYVGVVLLVHDGHVYHILMIPFEVVFEGREEDVEFCSLTMNPAEVVAVNIIVRYLGQQQMSLLRTLNCHMIIVEKDNKEANDRRQEADEVGPDVDCLVVALEQGLESLAPCSIVNPVACLDMRIELVIFGSVFLTADEWKTASPTC